ncbi:cyclin-dependent kinase 6-like [Genypterus blacodes]|uniref:cyclin-dependent kinase 6-like n=1 Tax=Genypterus blacodes TaxID=154954 RepID=UPI003F766564
MDCSAENLCYKLVARARNGAFGKMSKAREVGGNQRLLMVKTLSIAKESPESTAVLNHEVELLLQIKDFNHPNIVKLLDVSASTMNGRLNLTMVSQYVKEDLSTYLAKAPVSGLGRDNIKNAMLQLLSGLEFLHTNGVIHHYLNPENILVSSRGELKIADFGLAHIYKFSTAHSSCVVRLWYRAPEVLLKSTHMTAVDMWSVGCIFAELLLLKPLFDGATEVEQLQKIFQVIGLPSEENWPPNSPIPYSSMKRPKGPFTQPLPPLSHVENDLLAKCLQFLPSLRISATEALAHPFLTKR